MRDDEDIARLLPEPPPPRAARRDAAIGAAMRRFDGVETGPAAAPARTAWQRPAWTRPSRAQIGAFASIALVALVGVPLALTSLHQKFPAPAPSSSPVPVAARETAPAGQEAAIVQAPMTAHPAAPVSSRSSASVVPLPAPVPLPLVREPVDCGKGDCGAEKRDAPEELTVTASAKMAENRMASAPVAARAAPAPQFVPGYAKAEDESAGADIVITASRINRPAAAYRRGDWNACTVNDPSHSLDGCKVLVNSAAKGSAGEAAAHVADGLSLAWQGDLDGAIDAFDAAIKLQPRLAFAWLNRGLAYQRQGDADHALADLNRAVRYAPNAARGYYNRSLLLEQSGDTKRARADAERAVGIDPRYRAALE